MKTLPLAAAALLVSLAPAFAGSLSFDLPNLTWPTETTTTTSQSGQAAPVACTSGAKTPAACAKAK
jgi:hypothetical protein